MINPEPKHVSELIVVRGPSYFDRLDMKTIDVTEAWANAEIENFDLLTKDGYKIPIVKEHDMESGERLGYIEKIYYQDGNLQATAHWLVDEAKEKIESGQWAYVSGGWYNVTLNTGVYIPRVLYEVSLTARPFIKGSPTILNNDQQGAEAMSEREKELLEQIEKLKVQASERLVPSTDSVVVLNSDKQEALKRLAVLDPDNFKVVFGDARKQEIVTENPVAAIVLSHLLETMSEGSQVKDLTGQSFTEKDVDKLAAKLKIEFGAAVEILENAGAVFGG